MDEGLAFCGVLVAASAAAIALILSTDPSSATVDETEFKKLGYQVERTSIGESHGTTYGPMTAVLWVDGCRVEVEWREGGRRGRPSGWMITKPSLPPSIGESYPELATAHEHRMRLHDHPCLDKKTPGHVLRAPGSNDPS